MSRRRLLALLAVAAVLIVAVVFWRWRASASKPRLQIETAKADRGRIVAKVTATGTLSAIVTVQVGSQVSGRVAALYADFNSPVKKGQLIAKIDPQLFQAAVEQARANYVAAQGNLAKSKAQAADADRQYVRNKALAERKLIAQADLDTAQSNAEAARAQVDASAGAVEQARAALHQASVNLAYTDITSPTNGVVISRNVDVGQTVAASLQAPTLFVIAEDLAKMQVDTSVAEADVGRLTAGMSASFTVDAYPSETFQGAVRQIRNAPQTVQNVVTYDAVIDVKNPDLKLKPGMTANVTFVYAEKDDVLRVPNAALRFRPPPDLAAFAGNSGRPGGRGNPDGGAPAPKAVQTPDQRTVWVMRQDKPVPTRIKTGISDGAFTEVVEGGLEAGDAIVTDASGPPGGMAATLRRPF
ncbi:MAG TPA: efflux RND transporter periplasmic adaptor subunit [Anaeromyxobacteraceae bacterium]|nr:efflux RND transporter periplasmic adaptor subunit [Anaeromyxobacteraceae bacterium]